MIPNLILNMLPEAEKAAKAVKDTADVLPDVELTHHVARDSYAVARLLMDIDKFILSIFGLEHNERLFDVVYTILVFMLAFAVGWVIQKFIVWIFQKYGDRIHTDLYVSLRSNRFFSKTARIIPPLLFLILIQFTLNDKASLAMWLTRLSWIYITYLIANSMCLFAEAIWYHVDTRANKKKLPLRGLVQLVKGVIWIIAAIVIVGILINKSPGALLAGLGVFASVLMLIFKDSILGVVAGVQLSENDTLHVGDWIKVHGSDANGTVLEVSLIQVKIQNWDKTITTVPPYNLISGGFTNYRPMQESKTRRIQRSYMIDADSVLPVDEKMLEDFAKIPLLKDWISKKIEQRNAGKECDVNNPEGLVDGSIETNLGIFRAYMKLWLDANPNIDHSGGIGFCFVTTLPQSFNGIPLQIYCFTSTSAWLAYEAIMAGVFEHMAAMLYKFHLYTIESASGRDTLMDGWMSPGKNPDVLFGMPYPFFNASGTPDNPGYPVPQSASPTPSAMMPPSPAPAPAPAPSQTPTSPASPKGGAQSK